MLVLSRRPGEEIIINDNIRITVVAVKGDRIRIGITAPNNVAVDRAEVHERRTSFVDLAAPPLSGEHHETGIHRDISTLIIPKNENAGI